ncbi:hypothetical protein [Fibrobacter sp. UWR3]|uniref:hypothetical protein n=1 Tax=Fibrobacter sp. UWR3 TaxID=1896217 RepID=UPI0015B4713C|nr:hypothetical protein [Fibrobacter sp. UWR3]
MLLLDESSDFTELELLESEETFVSFVELLDLFSLLDDLSFSIFSSLDPFDSADAPLRVTLESGDSTDELETPVSSELADEESSQAERAKIAASTATHKKPRPLTHFIPLSPVKIFTTHKPSNVKYGMWNLYRKIHHQAGFELFKFVLINTVVHIFSLLAVLVSGHALPSKTIILDWPSHSE